MPMKAFRSSLPAITAIAGVLFAGSAMFNDAAIASPAVVLSSSAGPPTSTVTVTGSGFTASTLVDIYFDINDVCLSIASDAGAVSCSIKIPKEAQPQTHWISAVQRDNFTGAQKPFIVRTDWPQFHGLNAKHTGFNPYENVINQSNVRNLDILWQAEIGATRGTPVVWAHRVYI